MLSFGERLRLARERKDMTQLDVYRAIGLNNKSLSRYENGTTAPDPDTLRDLIRLYDVSSDYILGLFWVIYLDFFCLYCLYYFLYFCPPKIPVRFWNAFYSSSSSGAMPRCFMYMVAASFQKSDREYCRSCSALRFST
jgi:transcriptional regulator with XRE-family HTH domain